MTNRLDNIFKSSKAYVGYLTAGDGGIEKSVQHYLALIRGGVNVLEVGIPFSDPTADGPVIQRAMERALQRKITPHHVLEVVKKIRQEVDTPIIVFTYLNPLLRMGERFLHQAKEAGCDGVLIVDLPIEESESMNLQLKGVGLSSIQMISVDTPRSRIALIEKRGQGFLYYACRKGTTGVRSQLPNNFGSKIEEIRSQSSLNVVAGFGISNRQMASEVNRFTDGFVVGSAFVKAIEKGASSEELEALARSIDPR